MYVYKERTIYVRGHKVQFYTPWTDEEAAAQLGQLLENRKLRQGDVRFAASLLNERAPTQKQRDWIQRLVNDYEICYAGYQVTESQPGLDVFEKQIFHRRGRSRVPGSIYYIATGQIDVVRDWIEKLYNRYDPRGYMTHFRLQCLTDESYAVFLGSRSHSCE